MSNTTFIFIRIVILVIFVCMIGNVFTKVIFQNYFEARLEFLKRLQGTFNNDINNTVTKP